MKKRALLIVGLALTIAVAGVVYAHWTDTLGGKIDVTTGKIDVMWQSAVTDDDGTVNAPGGVDVGDNGLNELYNGNGADSSNDPANMWRCTTAGTPPVQTCAYLDGAIQRYDKDVAICEAEITESGSMLTATISKAYPSYHCTVFAQLSNEGNVPVKSGVFRLTVPGATSLIPWPLEGGVDPTTCSTDPRRCGTGIIFDEAVPEIVFDFADGTACGHQLDPYFAVGDYDTNGVWFHVEQAADPETNYVISWQQDFVNWNEFVPAVGTYPLITDANMCQIYINGTKVFPDIGPAY